jgi:hypothetical protein
MTHRAGIKLLFWASLLVLAVHAWKEDHFPADLALAPGIEHPPAQHPADEPPVWLVAGGERYLVRPRYRYELTGLVVSLRRHDADYGLHALWNDHVNVADICVVWGANATDLDLNRFDIRNGQFTCRWSSSAPRAWAALDGDAIANNHLITAVPRLREIVDGLRVGDQIRVTGWLADYGQPGGPVRRTSTTRSDRGNGACETILVEDVRVLATMDNGWRALFWPGLLGLLASIGWWLMVPLHRYR